MTKIRPTRAAAAAKKSVKLTSVKRSPRKIPKEVEEISQTTFDPVKADKDLESDSFLSGVKGIKSLKSTPVKVNLINFRDKYLCSLLI